MLAVILSGGSGTRLWPLSREAYPKQFLPVVSEDSLLAETIDRGLGLGDDAQVMAITNEEHRFVVAAHLHAQAGGRTAGIVLEPVGRNTAPAIALAALAAAEKNPAELMLVMPSDHVLKNAEAFGKAVAHGARAAEAGKLVTFGIVPGHPETGYGYIQQGPALDEESFKVNRFVEKPDQKTAEEYLASGDYLWNSGMFMFGARQYLAELEKHRPDILAICQAAFDGASEDLHFTRINESIFAECPEDSVDYAVMEKTDNAAVVSLEAGWSDIGSWSALWDVSDKDQNDNTFTGDVIAQDTERTLVRADSRLVATVGVKDLVIIETKDALLVAHKDKVQDVKKVVERIKGDGRHEHMNHREVYRPWGVYDSIDNGNRYQVKRITVKPGAKLSVQMHHHRAEHWIVVSGTARVTNGEKTYLVTENQSTYIPIGQVHSLENPGVINLELIEVQSGSYLGEDDIVRLKDMYGRT